MFHTIIGNMNKLFVCMTVAMSLMGCATSNNIESAADQAIEIANSGEGQMRTMPQDSNDEVSPSEASWQTDEAYHNGVEAFVVSGEDAIAEQTGHLQPPADTQQTDTIAAADSTNSATADTDDFATVPQQLSGNREPHIDKVIYLTFDDGPSNITPKILDILEQENVKATFFVTGHHENYVYLIKREFEEGHAIGAHSYSHKYEIYTSQETFFKDLERLQKVIEKYTGSRTRLIRFPGGSSNDMFSRYNEDPNFMRKLCKEVRRRGYQYIDWNLSSKDSRNSYVPASTIVTMACRDTNHDICLLLHDTFGKESTVKALPSIIQYYKEKGYRFGTLDVTSAGYHHI